MGSTVGIVQGKVFQLAFLSIWHNIALTRKTKFLNKTQTHILFAKHLIFSRFKHFSNVTMYHKCHICDVNFTYIFLLSKDILKVRKYFFI